MLNVAAVSPRDPEGRAEGSNLDTQYFDTLSIIVRYDFLPENNTLSVRFRIAPFRSVPCVVSLFFVRRGRLSLSGPII